MAYLVFHHSNDAMIRRKLLPSKLDQMTHIQRCVSNDSKNDLVGGAITILKNDGVQVNGKDDIPYMKWKIKNVWNHQPDNVSLYGRPNYPIPLRIFADFFQSGQQCYRKDPHKFQKDQLWYQTVQSSVSHHKMRLFERIS